MSPTRRHESQYLGSCELASLSAKALPFSSNSHPSLCPQPIFLFPGCSKVYCVPLHVPRFPKSLISILIFNLFPSTFSPAVKNLPQSCQAQCFLIQWRHPIYLWVLLLQAKGFRICSVRCSFQNNCHKIQMKIGIENTLNSSKPL